MTTTDDRPAVTADEASGKPMPSWQSAPCPSWCRWEHDERGYPEDREHSSAIYRRALYLEGPAEVSDGVWEPEDVCAWLWQHVREVEPRVQVRKGEGREGFDLTLEDADVFAGLLQGLVEEARRG